MKNKKVSLIAKAMILILSLSFVAADTKTVLAENDATIDTSVIDEQWGKPTYAYGAGLSDSDINYTAELLKIDTLENVNSVKVTGQDLVTFLGAGSGNDSSMISSVLVRKEPKGKGINVNIITKDNITQITEGQYVNASITAGVTDATIIVAASRPVTGESALTGVYKAFSENGIKLDKERTEVAQEELEVTNEIAKENKENKDFDITELNKLIVSIKQDLAEFKEKNKDLATKEDIERIINEALEKYKLENVITKDQIEKLIALFEKYQKTDAINSKDVIEELNKFSKNLGDKVSDLYNKAEDAGWIPKIQAFFSKLFKALSDLFK